MKWETLAIGTESYRKNPQGQESLRGGWYNEMADKLENPQ